MGRGGGWGSRVAVGWCVAGETKIKAQSAFKLMLRLGLPWAKLGKKKIAL